MQRGFVASYRAMEDALPRVTFGSNLQRHMPRPASQVSGATVGEVLRNMFQEDALLGTYVLDEQGRLRKHVNIFLNNASVKDRLRLADACQPSDEIYVFQALSGG